MRREEGFTVLLVIALRSIQETINPGKKFLGAVVGVEDYRDAVLFRESADVKCTRDSPCNGSGIVLIIEAFSCVELSK